MVIESALFTTAYYVQRLKSQYKVHLLCTIGFIVIPGVLIEAHVPKVQFASYRCFLIARRRLKAE